MNHHHGICIPLSYIHSENSCGIGEILDLLPLIDWIKQVGFDMLQLLPLNDTGLDPSPYSALSSCAINPVYLSLSALPYLDNSLKEPLSLLKELNLTLYINYQAVRVQKEKWLNTYLDKVEDLFIKDPAYQDYVTHTSWLTPYAEFVTLAKCNEYHHWQHWIHKDIDRSKVEREKIIQFLLFQQLQHVKQQAAAKGVLIMGDIPILVSSQSADVWKNQNLFDLNNTVGVPPDIFSDVGQSWGFPFFNWDADREGAFNLWHQRLKYAENFYHFYRIDHIIGFFRLWKIPNGKLAKEGHYEPGSIDEATQRGREILEEIIRYSEMKPIGEDLGIILPPFRDVMRQLSIPGIRVMRWERCWDSSGAFIPVEKYEPLNLVCVSTHDTETLEQWWNQMSQESSLYCQLKGFAYRPMDQEIRLLCLRDSHKANTQYHVNLFHEYLALYPELVHDKSYEERINTPGTQPEHNWKCRLLLPLEQVLSHQGLKDSIAHLLS
jgi:4-alpha-glucanotransferase